ncbi:MAG TPA: hypothetical protein ENK09_04415 [Nitrospirae bacterium]|nr:hypothetical protein [Nitrospirota bacterium]
MKSEYINKLVKELQSPDPERRRQAAEELQYADERAIYPLIRALEDENPGVSDAAMRSLISIGGEVTAYMMLPLLREHALLRNTALLVMKEIGNIRIIRKLLIDKDDDVRKFGVDLIAELKDRESCPYLRDLMKDPNPNVRAATASAIGKIGCHDLKDELIEALDDDEWVCFSALDSMGRLKDVEFIEPLSRLLDSGSDAIRYAAIEALSAIPHPEAAGILKGYLKKAADSEKKLILKALVNSGLTPEDGNLKETFLEMLRSDDRDEMIHALKGLVLIKASDAVREILERGGEMDPLNPLEQDLISIIRESIVDIGSCDVLIELLRSGELKYRAKVIAIESIGELGCKDAVGTLVELLRSDIRDIRRAGMKAIGKMKCEEAYEEVITAIEDPDGHVRRAAIKALGDIGDKRAFEPLSEHLKAEPYKDVREETVITLLRLDEERFLDGLDEYDLYTKKLVARFTNNADVLIRLSEAEEMEVRIEAIRRLGEFAFEEKCLDRLKELVKDRDAEIRRAAVISLIDSGYGEDMFLNLLDDTDMWVRYYAVKGIGATAPERHISRLKEMLKDRNIPVVIETIRILKKYSEREDIRKNLKSLVNHPEAEIRETALEALSCD